MPSSPPKKLRRISELEATSSPKPSEIIANAVPPRRVETEPKTIPNSSPENPPTSGIRNTGTGRASRASVFIACAARKPPSP